MLTKNATTFFERIPHFQLIPSCHGQLVIYALGDKDLMKVDDTVVEGRGTGA